MDFKISDWVQGKAQGGELIYGFIDSINELDKIVSVYVVKSDNDNIVGKIAAVREHWLKSVPVISLEDTQLMHNLIDMALATRDESWFMELTETLRTIQNSSVQVKEHSKARLAGTNRLSQSS